MADTPELISKQMLDRYPLPFVQENYPDLFDAVKRDNLIVFIGAGVSKLLGCSLWDELAVKLAKKICTYGEADVLEKEAIVSPRKVISICYGRCNEDSEKLQIYKKTIEEELAIVDKEKAKSLYNKIFELDPKAYITTNIDLGIIDALPEAKRVEIYDCTRPEDLAKIEIADFNVLRDGNIIFLHGTIKNIEEIIFPVEKYLKHYRDDHKIIIGLLKTIFKEGNVILFIGYSLTEWEIIEKIYRLTGEGNKEKKIKTSYLLTPLYSHEYTKYVLDKDYYTLFNVEIIPYFIDYDGYGKLEVIIENLAKAVDKHKPSPLEILGEIEDVAKYA